MQDLARKAITGLTRFQIVMALMLFLPAWTVRFWEAWVYWLLILGVVGRHHVAFPET